MQHSPQFLRLSGFYLYYFALLGALLPFWGLYLQSKSFSLSQIGLLMALLLGTKLVAPLLWGWLADRTGKRLSIIRMGAFLAVVCFVGIFWQPGLWGMALVMMSFSFFWNAILPQYEVITLQSLDGQIKHYSKIRSWGSIGFIIAVVGLGWYFESHSIQHLPVIMMTLLVLIFIASLLTKKPPYKQRTKGDLKVFLKELMRTPVVLYLIICLLMQISHGPYYSFFSIYLAELNYSKTHIGWFWSLGVIAEIIVFLLTPRLFARYSERALLMACLVITAFRWYLTGAFANNGIILFVAQIGHGASFGLFHALAIYSIHQFFTTASSGQGQAMYSAFSFGLGSAIGAYGSGHIVEQWGMPFAYYLAALTAAVGIFFACLFKTKTITNVTF